MALFAADGFDATSIRAIAERCGLSDPAVYYYFPSKADLLNALWSATNARSLRNLPVKRPLTVARVAELTAAMLDASAEQDELVRLMVRQVLAGDQTAAALRNQTMSYWRRYLLPHFLGSFSEADADLRVQGVTMVVLGATFLAQMDHPTDYPAFCRSAAFRQHVEAMVCVVTGLRCDGEQL